MKPLVLKAHVRGMQRGRFVGDAADSVTLVHKANGSVLKLPDNNFELKLVGATIELRDDIDTAPTIEVTVKQKKAIIQFRDDAETRSFLAELEQAVAEGQKKSSGSGGFQPVNNLGRGPAPTAPVRRPGYPAAGGGGGGGRGLGALPGTKSSAVVSRVHPSSSGGHQAQKQQPGSGLFSPREPPRAAMSPPRSSSSSSSRFPPPSSSSSSSRALQSRSAPSPPPSPKRNHAPPEAQRLTGRSVASSSSSSDSVPHTPPKKQRQAPASAEEHSVRLPSASRPSSLEVTVKQRVVNPSSSQAALPVSCFGKQPSSAPTGIRKFTTAAQAGATVLKKPRGPSQATSATVALPSSSSSSSALTGGALEGFPNLGNTCYLNAVLRCLLSLPSFSNDLLSSFWVAPLRHEMDKAPATASAMTALTSPPASASSSKLMQLRVYSSLLRIGLLDKRRKHGIIDPSLFRQAMAAHYNEYGSKNQQDAHEFLGDVINTLQEELGPIARRGVALALALAEQQQPKQQPLPPLPQLLAKAGLALLQEEKEDGGHASAEDKAISEAEVSALTQILPVSRNFHIEVVKTLTCASCGYSRSRVEPYTDFSLDLLLADHTQQQHPHNTNDSSSSQGSSSSSAASSKVLDIPELLRGFFTKQVLELACEKCGHDKVDVEFSLDKLPNVLVIHLKRFRLDGTLNQKLTTKVKAPTSIDLRPFCTEYTHNPPRQGLLPQPVKEQDCAFLLAEQTPAPPPPPSSSSDDRKSSGPSSSGPPPANKQPALESPPAPPAPSKLSGLVENRHKRHLDVAIRRSQDSDRWGEEGGETDDETEALIVSERKKRKSLTPKAEEGRGQAGGEALLSRGPGGSSSVATALLMDSEAISSGEVVDLAAMEEEEEEERDQDLQDAIQRSLQDQQQAWLGQEEEDARPSPMDIYEDDEAAGPSTLAPPLAPLAPLQPAGEDKENVCPNAHHHQSSSQQRSAHKPIGAAPAPSAGSPFNLSLLTPAAASREHRTKRQEPLQSAYELKCVIRHIGKYAFSGHYIADVRTKEGPGLAGGPAKVSWKRHDDSVVSKLSDDDGVLEEERSMETAYLLFYTLNTTTSTAKPPATASRD